MDPIDREVIALLRTLPKPEPPPWLHARIQAAIAAEQRRGRRWTRRRRFALALLLQLLVFAVHERTLQ